MSEVPASPRCITTSHDDSPRHLPAGGDRAVRVAVIGGGVSAGALIRALLAEFPQSNRPARRLEIKIYDPGPETGSGLAFGRAAGRETLCISESRHLFPEPLRSRWHAWILEQRTDLIRQIQQDAVSRPSLLSWLDRNLTDLQTGELDRIYFPRWLIGAFLRDELAGMVAAAGAECEVEHVRDSVTGLVRVSETRYHINCASGRTDVADIVVLTLGHPPKKTLGQGGDHYIPNLYHRSIDDSLTPLRETGPHQNILIIGSNAAALDAIFILRHSQGFQGHIDVMSPSGTFPDQIVATDHTPAEHIEISRILDEAEDEPLQLVEAAVSTINDLKTAGYRSSQLMFIRDETIRRVRRMAQRQQAEFCELHAMDFVRCLRRAGDTYRHAIDHLAAEGRLDIHAAEVHDIKDVGGRVAVSYTKAGVNKCGVFDWVIDAAGWQKIGATADPLLSSLTRPQLRVEQPPDPQCPRQQCPRQQCRHQQWPDQQSPGQQSLGQQSPGQQFPGDQSPAQQPLVAVNRSGRGFKVDDRMQAAANLFVFGPLLAGSLVNGRMIWHLESALDIETLAPVVAKEILNAL